MNTTKFVEDDDDEEGEAGCRNTIQRNRKKTYRLNSFGIQKLINLNVFDDAYPIHDGELEDEGKKGGDMLKNKTKYFRLHLSVKVSKLRDTFD